MKRSSHSRLCIEAALTLALLPSAGNGAPLVSAMEHSSASASGHSFTPVLSGDATRIAFVSQARNLVTNDNLSLHLNVYLRDLQTASTILASVNQSGIGGGDDDSTAPSISSNGRWVAFQSAASNLVPGDTNGATTSL